MSRPVDVTKPVTAEDLAWLVQRNDPRAEAAVVEAEKPKPRSRKE